MLIDIQLEEEWVLGGNRGDDFFAGKGRGDGNLIHISD